MRLPLWARLVLLLVAGKLTATLVGELHRGVIPDHLDLAFMLGFGTASLLLFVVGSEDPRATSLAGFFLVMATAFCRNSLKASLDAEEGAWLDLARVANSLKVDGFLPFFLWTFARNFPEAPVPRRLKRLIATGATVSAWTGFVLFAAYMVAGLAAHGRTEVYGALGTLYDLLIIVLLLPLPPILVYKARLTRPEEGRRARLFAVSLAVAVTPALLLVLAEFLSARFKSALVVDHRFQQLVWSADAFLLTLPVTTSYAVLVHHVLPVRLIARRALQYALARYSALGLAAVPFVVLCSYVYSHQDLRVYQFFSGTPAFLLLAWTVAGFAALRYRGRLLESIDRRFFREQYDVRQILTLVVQRLREIHEVRDIADFLCRGIDQALHLQSIAVLVEDPRSGNLVDPRSRARKLDASSGLAQRVAGATDPLPVDLDQPSSGLAKLPEADRAWLADSRFRLLVPIVARNGALVGLIGLGDKKSGLPFLKEDRKLLVNIASSAALGLELELRQTWSSRGADDSLPGFPVEPASSHHPPENAKECLSCGALYLPYTVFCGNCSRRLEPSVVPYVLPGKFRFERRLGHGGMGVVYRGIDLGLGRAVAVKTLKRVSPDDAMRLRREARTAAAVSHPHLAGVFGLETWQGTPLLVMELMEGGTLTQRITKGTLSARETVELGIAMAQALEHLHAADILHRDVKPSNIGYTKDGVPKLMDFGIARVLLDLRPDRTDAPDLLDEDDSVALTPTSLWNHSPTSVTLSRQLVGTLSYLSPEALNGEAPNPSFDLWALGVVLYECILARKLFAGMDMKQTMMRIRQGRVPDYEQSCPDLDPVFGQFLRSALHRTLARRPGSAREMRRRLEEVRTRLREPPPEEV
jgi:hypothetical protein